MFQIPARFDALFALAMHVHGTPEGMALTWDEVGAQVHELARAEQNLPAGEFGLSERMDARSANLPDARSANLPDARSANLPDARSANLPDARSANLADARFAAHVFVDEVLFRSPRPGELSGLGWSAHALQNRYFGTNDGGELFYTRLANVLNRLEREVAPQTLLPLNQPDRQLRTAGSAYLPTRFRDALSQEPENSSSRASLAVFAQCLAWGFRGKLYTHEEELRDLRDAACSMLSAACAPLPAVELPPVARKTRVPFLTDCEPLLHVLAPLAISAVWYFLCADIITRAVRF